MMGKKNEKLALEEIPELSTEINKVSARVHKGQLAIFIEGRNEPAAFITDAGIVMQDDLCESDEFLVLMLYGFMVKAIDPAAFPTPKSPVMVN